MKILITPHDIIERALWQKYQFFILEGEKELPQSEIDEMIKENKEFEISEREALIMNLLKCIETDNLVHRLNQHILHILGVRSTEVTNNKKKLLCITKASVDNELNKFLKNFPDTWVPNVQFEKSLRECKIYVDELNDKLSKLVTIEVDMQGNTIEYVQVTHVKKMLNLNT